MTCPKCGYVRQAADQTAANECPQCGVIYAKYVQYLADREPRQQQAAVAEERAAPGWLNGFRGMLLHRPDNVATLLPIYGLLYIAFLAWGVRLIAYDPIDGEIGSSFLHQINLPFHEFGHVLFRPFGEWMMFLGGSLFQCLWPLILCGVFLLRERQPFSASLCLWWAGENLLDVAPYIGDARAMDLPLIGEMSEEDAETRFMRHDWHNILQEIGKLEWDHRLAHLAHFLGAAVMVVAWVWGGLWLWRCYRIKELPPA
ncbi:MAG: hypothetical protein JO218_06055 [Burkholderiales bacterium]|nr:hypothetical protein [Burkholderiales bacterium]